MRNDQMHRRGQPNGRGQGQGGGRQGQHGQRRMGGQRGGQGQGYFNPNENWGSRGYGGGSGDQGVEDWRHRDEEMDRGQYVERLGHGDDTDWRQDDQSFGGEFIDDENPGRFGQGNEAGSRDYGMGGYGTHGGGSTTGGQWGTQGSQGVGSYGGQGLGGGPGGYYGQGPTSGSGSYGGYGYGSAGSGSGFGQRQGQGIGGPSSGGMGWRGEPHWQGGQRGDFGSSQQQQRYEPGPKGYKRSDDRIKEDVSDRISQMQHVDSSDVEVEVKGGEVTLTGTVPNRVMKWQLENLVESIGGVSDVNNQLRIRREGGFMQQIASSAKSAINALNPNESNNTQSSQEHNARRGSVPTTGSQDAGPVTRK